MLNANVKCSNLVLLQYTMQHRNDCYLSRVTTDFLQKIPSANTPKLLTRWEYNHQSSPYFANTSEISTYVKYLIWQNSSGRKVPYHNCSVRRISADDVITSQKPRAVVKKTQILNLPFDIQHNSRLLSKPNTEMRKNSHYLLDFQPNIMQPSENKQTP